MEIAGIVSLAALGVVIASLGYLHLAPSGLSPLRNAVSQYGVSAYRAGYRVATIAFAAAGVALAVGIGKAVSGLGTVIAALVVFAAARALISWFPMDVPGSERTTTGQVHGLLAIVAFLAISFAAIELGRDLGRAVKWHALGPLSSGLGYAMLAALLVMAFARTSPAVRNSFGLIERLFYVLAISWSVVFALACAARIR
jgi:hypothetical protein